MQKKSIIGIVSKHRPINITKSSTYIGDEIKQALFDNGAIAIGILPAHNEIQYCTDEWRHLESTFRKDELIEQIKLCDGIILQGGIETDSFECFIAKYCYDNDIPCLGICAGQNVIVRGLGGKTKDITNPEKHNQGELDYVHNIKINRESYFYSIIGKDEIMVNSWHKKTIDDGKQLVSVAFDDDGYPDVLEDKTKKIYMGLRFHPESLYKTDDNMNNIFKEFIKKCEQNKKD